VSSTSRPSRLPEYLAGLYALLIVYASLESFSAWMAPLPGTPFFLFAPWPPRFTRFDVEVNLLAYAPLGFFVALAGRRPELARMTAATGAGLLLSFAMETMQMFIPTRDASAMDLVCNTAGAGIGGLSAIAFDRTGLRASVSAWRRRVFFDGRGADLGLALLAIWLLAELNPGIPLFAATFDPSLELTRDLAGTLLQAAESAFNVIGVGLFLALPLRQRRFVGGAVLMLIGTALIFKARRGKRADQAVGAGDMDQTRACRSVSPSARLVLLLAVCCRGRSERRCARFRCWPRWSPPLLAPDMACARRLLFRLALRTAGQFQRTDARGARRVADTGEHLCAVGRCAARSRRRK
jgi:VanZ family protein